MVNDEGARLLLVLGDQLTLDRGALAGARPGQDIVLLAEVAEEASYVRHNKHKIALVFAAMRHFHRVLEQAGFEVFYYRYEDGVASLEAAVQRALKACKVVSLRSCQPGEYRLQQAMDGWRLPVPHERIEDDRFLVTPEYFADWASGRKSLRMEYFYREIRRKYQLLLDDEGGPEGGRWNYDAENRAGWRSQVAIPERPQAGNDDITGEVLELVEREFPDNPGQLEHFNFATTQQQAHAQFDWFLAHGLPLFGKYQDALAEDSPWLFHAVVSMYMNIGLLDPLAMCRAVEDEYRAGRCELAAAEGFIRQVAGWREYVRGIYWLYMPDYGAMNSLQARTPLPDWFWSGETDMRCLSTAIGQSLDLGYAHHIQRLMVIGNYALLAGLDTAEVCDWYLAVYADAYEWVELPNTLGMALHGDEGIMASKPYAASGKYIQRQGDHCKQCRYSPGEVTGPGACPFNSLYWRFIHSHSERWQRNPRMALALRNWQRKPAQEQEAILSWADKVMP